MDQIRAPRQGSASYFYVNRLKAVAFPVPKTLDGFDVAAYSIPPKTFDYVASREWIRT